MSTRPATPSSPPSPTRVTALVSMAEVFSMTAVAVYPALLPVLAGDWRLSNAEAGVIGGVFYGGYMAAVPLLTGLTDRVDARRIYLFSCLLAAVGAVGFSTLAQDLGSAIFFQAILGAGLAGTYMPGLKLLSDNVAGPRQSRAISFYTSSFGIGSSLSLWLAGRVAAIAGWRAAFFFAAAGPLLAGPLVFWGLAASPVEPASSLTPAFRFRAVVRNFKAMAYIVGYAAHCWELFGFRSWLVAFLTWSAALHAGGSRWAWSATSVAAAITLLGPPASILGNEFAGRSGRRRFLKGIRFASLALAGLVGFSGTLPWLIPVSLAGLYFLVIMSDSAALTAGLVDAASPDARGATMAVHSFLGFGAAFVAPVFFGLVLDGAGGTQSPLAWGLSFLSLGTGYALAWGIETMHRPRR